MNKECNWTKTFGEGTIVKYKDIIYEGDELARFVVVEDLGDRLVVGDLFTKSVLGSTMCFASSYFVKA